MKRFLIILFGGFLLTACGVIRWGDVPGFPKVNQGYERLGGGNYASNGERIYFTAVNDSGQRLPYAGGPTDGGMMVGMGANLACDSCHGSDGRGGIHTMHMDVMDAPDIRYSALIGEEDEHGGDESHGDEHSGYDLETFRLAVVDGKHPNGDALNRDMPRWRMSDEDLADLFAYLRTIP